VKADNDFLTLGIETSCDETSASVVRGAKEVLSNIVASQFDLHSKYGGVVPELACRRHLDIMDKVVESAFDEAGTNDSDLDLVSVVRGPGLIGALLIGVMFAKAYARAIEKPIIGLNHLEAHLYSTVMSNEGIEFPAVGLIVSGGHTSLYHMPVDGEYQLLGSTVDDAVGESFDKVGSLLGLPYPGGPNIEKVAKMGDPHSIDFPRGMTKKKSYSFSYAGLKTAVLYHLKGHGGSKRDRNIISDEEKYNVAASFQHAALEVIVNKSIRAAKDLGVKSILVGGGVSQSNYLRDMFIKKASKHRLEVYFPARTLCTDNAAMVAGLGYVKYTQNPELAGPGFEADPNIRSLS